MSLRPVRFIGERVEAHFAEPPLLEKRPGCPDGFSWRGETYQVVELLSEWQDFTRRGRMARNMSPTHARAAVRRGSWGVGRWYYRVRTAGGQVFDLYYDRSPKGPDERKGIWLLLREMAEG
jgi:hypothetical protein